MEVTMTIETVKCPKCRNIKFEIDEDVSDDVKCTRCSYTKPKKEMVKEWALIWAMNKLGV